MVRGDASVGADIAMDDVKLGAVDLCDRKLLALGLGYRNVPARQSLTNFSKLTPRLIQIFFFMRVLAIDSRLIWSSRIWWAKDSDFDVGAALAGLGATG